MTDSFWQSIAAVLCGLWLAVLSFAAKRHIDEDRELARKVDALAEHKADHEDVHNLVSELRQLSKKIDRITSEQHQLNLRFAAKLGVSRPSQGDL